MRQPSASATKKTAGERKRARRTPEEARRQILEAAETLLVAGGLHAVTVRSVGERVGMTDMGVNHHFGTREALLEELLGAVALRVRQQLALKAEEWLRDHGDMSSLVELFANVYTVGLTQLALVLYQAGWRDRNRPILEPVVQALHTARIRQLSASVDIEETRLAVAAMHQALALDPVFGMEFRRSAGLTGQEAKATAPTLRWWAITMAQTLGLPERSGVDYQRKRQPNPKSKLR